METFFQAVLGGIVVAIVTIPIGLFLEYRTHWFARADSPVNLKEWRTKVLRWALSLMRTIVSVGVASTLLTVFATYAPVPLLHNAMDSETRVLLLTIALAGAVSLGWDRLLSVLMRIRKEESGLAVLAQKHESDFQRLVTGQSIEVFDELFRGHLSSWDFDGEWRVESQTLVVGQADRGGVVKHGFAWRDYTLTVVARIVTGNLGIIIRATDPHNYYMLQVGSSGLVCPHRRQFPWPPDRDWAWQLFPSGNRRHNCTAGEWFTATVTVVGRSASLFLNGEEVFHQEDWLDTEAGSVGLRCAPGTHTPEEAQVACVKVVLHTGH